MDKSFLQVIAVAFNSLVVLITICYFVRGRGLVNFVPPLKRERGVLLLGSSPPPPPTVVSGRGSICLGFCTEKEYYGMCCVKLTVIWPVVFFFVRNINVVEQVYSNIVLCHIWFFQYSS